MLIGTGGLIDNAMAGGLSSSNGGVGSLLQHIEQSEKSQGGETEQDDYLLNFFNMDTKGA